MIYKCIQHINKGNSVIAERFIRTLKDKIYKCMATVPKKIVY